MKCMPLMNNILQDTTFASTDIRLRQKSQAINKPVAASKDINVSQVQVLQAKQDGIHAGQFLTTSLIQVQVSTAMHDPDDSKVKVDLKP